MRFMWLGHASFQLKTKDGLVIYIDPYLEPYVSYPSLEKADLILISQWSYDHCTMESIKRLKKEDTAVWGTPEAASEMFACIPFRENEKRQISSVIITAVAAYAARTSRRPKHPRSYTLGYVFSWEKRNLYYTSDSEPIPEMNHVKADTMVVPVGGTWTMAPREALQAIDSVRPHTVIPIHYSKLEGTVDNALLLKELVEAKKYAEVKIVKVGEQVEI